jgi:hypothetical protein
MKRTLIHAALSLTLLGAICAPSALAQHRHRDREAMKACDKTYRDALKDARHLPPHERRERQAQAKREHTDCLSHAWH